MCTLVALLMGWSWLCQTLNVKHDACGVSYHFSGDKNWFRQIQLLVFSTAMKLKSCV
jgi:hypothetical protein